MDYLTSWWHQPKTNFERQEDVRFFIHDEEHLVKAQEYPPTMTLNYYLRQVASMTGTKNMCLEGGCGACVVTVSFPDPISKRNVVIAVNSCLVLIYSCAGWKIYTAEGIGNVDIGVHPIQNAMVKFNGTQCGFCTSGMIMNMYALYESKKNLTMKEVENSFGGNICRCTGYRPILTAFKSLAVDASSDVLGTYSDIEDFPTCRKDNCRATCVKPCEQPVAHYFDSEDCKWYKAYSINEVLEIIDNHPDDDYMLVGGNTASGVYKHDKRPDVYIDITSVPALLIHTIADNKLILGANMTLANTLNLFNKLSADVPNFGYLKKMAEHLDLVAHVAVRNIATLAGNLFTKHKHPDFASDIFLILETAGATLTLINTARQEEQVTLTDFLKRVMKNTIIKNIMLPSLDDTFKYESYKIMPVTQNAHAIVNAGFLTKLNYKNEVKSVRIVYGGINPSFVHATNAEEFLLDKELFDDQTLQDVLKLLDKELNPDHVLPDPSPKFRKNLAMALFYKYILSIAPTDDVSFRNRSGGKKLSRPVSMGTQDFGTNKSMYPLTQPVNKLEALAQSTGTAEYIMDMPNRPGQLFAAFVVAKAKANSTIVIIDPSDALRLQGVKGYYDKNDIPGENTFTPVRTGIFISKDEELFCSGRVKYYFQPVGVVVATSQALAQEAADLVKITYAAGTKKPLFTIKEILKNNAKDKIKDEFNVEAKKKGDDIAHVVKGNFNIGQQYHYHMETQCCVVIPNEDGLDLFGSTQDPSLTQHSAAKVLNLSANKINVTVRRVGGAYGAKLMRNGMISCAAALAAHKLKKPVKFSMTMESNMEVIGKRFPFYGVHEVGVNKNGVIQYLNSSTYSDFGSDGGNENVSDQIIPTMSSTYKSDTFTIDVHSTRTDTATGCWCRGPATLEAVAYLENIMQNVAVEIGMDPITFRLNNVVDDKVRKFLTDLLSWAKVRDRQKDVAKFNRENRWVKKGLSVVPMVFPLPLYGTYHVYVSIFQGDGSIAITHGGVEMGQGINTKVAQVCAYILKVPLDIVTVKPSQTVVCPNDFISGGSITSESVCLATMKACEILNERLQPFRDEMEEPVDWKELIYQAFKANVDLCGSFMYYPTIPPLEPYLIYGATCVEVILDTLTGMHQIIRADLLEDTGDSMSPNVDIGQIEGGFIMGMGYWTSEEMIFSPEGRPLTNRTWNYKPPGAKDIPVDFRVKLPKNIPNKVGVLNSKATGEPPTCMAIAVALALKDAVASARVDSSPSAKKWYMADGPCTVEDNFLKCLNDYTQYKL